MLYDTDIENSLKDALQAEKGVATAYVFGSLLTGRFGPESDVDIALLFFPDKVPSALDVFEMEHRLASAVACDVDVVVLNTASPVIGMQVLRTGRKLVERSSRITNEFFVRCVNLYADLKRIREPVERGILNGRIFPT